MSYRLGVDVGGTFTDLLLIDETSGRTFTAKVPSTPQDSSVGVLNGVEKICAEAGIASGDISRVMHGTTVATNAILTRRGAKVGLVTTRGYRQTLQIARSFVPGGLGGWVIFEKPEPLADLQFTIEAHERIDAAGGIVEPLDEARLAADLESLKGHGIEALTICLINSFNNPEHERRVRDIARQTFGDDVPISISFDVVPEMQEYERTETTVVNSYVRPVVARYLANLQRELDSRLDGVQLSILRSDGGLASTEAASSAPVNLLLSGPAGGVTGAIWFAGQAGHRNILTFDMGGTSTDVCLIEDCIAKVRRETSVGDVTVRAPSVDVRTVGAGGGSIAFVPELTRALRVGPDSAGADPGPAAYRKGGEAPTVTDANVVLGYLPATAKLGGDMVIDRDLAVAAVQQVADAMGIGLYEAAEGIINIVNENMFGALRLVSVEQGYDPREFALVGFGGAGPLHANALGILTGSWPVIIPPGPGVLCAYGDATTKPRNEAARTYIRRFADATPAEIVEVLETLQAQASEALSAEGVTDQQVTWQADLRYSGQGLVLSVDVTREALQADGLAAIARPFDALHEQMFTFTLDVDHELVNLRAIVQGTGDVQAAERDGRTGTLEEARIGDTEIYHAGARHAAVLYDRAALTRALVVPGPAIIAEMDSTTVILPGHQAEVDALHNLLITPSA